MNYKSIYILIIYFIYLNGIVIYVGYFSNFKSFFFKKYYQNLNILLKIVTFSRSNKAI